MSAHAALLSAHAVILSAAKNLLTAIVAVAFIVSCGGPEPLPPTPPAPEKDTQAPVITVKQKEFNVIAGVVATLGGSELKL